MDEQPLSVATGAAHAPAAEAGGEPIRVKLVPYNPFFPIQEMELPRDKRIRIGRYQGTAGDAEAKLGLLYKSTVVSRRHAEIWTNGVEVYVQDTASLGGTWINNNRLSLTGTESPPVRLKHGDVLQLGVDYRPSQPNQQPREKDKCVELKVEITPHLKPPRAPRWSIPGAAAAAASAAASPGVKPKAISCCICLSTLRMRQTLLVAPCGHLFHYKCVTPMLGKVIFACPLCRDTADLHASVESMMGEESDSDDEDENTIKRMMADIEMGSSEKKGSRGPIGGNGSGEGSSARQLLFGGAEVPAAGPAPVAGPDEGAAGAVARPVNSENNESSASSFASGDSGDGRDVRPPPTVDPAAAAAKSRTAASSTVTSSPMDGVAPISAVADGESF